MPWYRTGTVACTQNSTTVTGTGTAFAANCRVGDAFLGPDGAEYEVANVASDTVLSILPAYKSASVSGSGYALMPVQGYPKDLVDQARVLIGKFGTLAAAPIVNGLAGLALPADALTYLGAVAKAGDKITGALGFAARVDYTPTSNTIDVMSVNSNSIRVLTSTAYNITSLGGTSAAVGMVKELAFNAGGHVFIHSSNLVMTNAANYTTAPGDTFFFECVAANTWRCIGYMLQSGKAINQQVATQAIGTSTLDPASTAFVRNEAVKQGQGTGMQGNAVYLGWNGADLIAQVDASPLGGLYYRKNIIGTVGQSAGVPTGAIIESGSNSNGYYIRFADGTQICIKRVGTDAATSAVGTALYGSNAYGSGAYPAAFSSIPTVTCQAYYQVNGSIGYWASCYNQATISSWGDWRVVSATSLSSGGVLNLVAIGRWYG